MSGQLLVRPPDAPDEKHLRVRLPLRRRRAPSCASSTSAPSAGSRSSRSSPTAPDGLPAPIAHIARDPLDPAFDDAAFHAALRRRRTGLKRALLDQTLISGVGNIYADEALWRARLHYERPTATLTPAAQVARCSARSGR